MRAAAIRKLVILVGWFAFAIYTLDAGRNPGLVRNPDLVPYPWTAVFLTWLVLAAQAFSIAALLRPRALGRRARLWPTAGWLGLQSAVGVALTVTDMPGYYYVPTLFAFTAFVIVLGTALGHSMLTASKKTLVEDKVD